MADQSQQLNPDIMDEVALLSYVEDLLKQRTDLKLTPEEFPRVQTAVLNEVHEMLNSHMVGLLSEEDQKELNTYLDNNPTDEQLLEFFGKKIPNLQAEITSVLINFRMAYLAPVLGKQTQPVDSNTNGEEIIPAPPVPENAIAADFNKEMTDLQQYLKQAKAGGSSDPVMNKDVPDKQWN